MATASKFYSVKEHDLNDIAKEMVMKISEGYIFITHEGTMVGPSSDREQMVATAALYLATKRKASTNG